MTSLVGKEKLIELKKDNIKIILLYILPTLAFAGVVALFFIFSNRNLRTLFPILLAIITTIYFVYILFLSVIPVKQHVSYMKMCKESLSGTKFENRVFCKEIEEKETTVRGVSCLGIHFLEADEKQEIVRYVTYDNKNVFEVNKSYKIHTHHQIVVAYEETGNEKGC